MSNFFSRLFGSDNVVKGLMNGADKLVLTNEEKLDAHMMFLKLYEPFKLAQRFLALIFAPPYMLAWFITFVMSCFGIDIKDQLDLLQGDIANIIGVIMGFYFGGGAIEGIVKAAKTSEKK